MKKILSLLSLCVFLAACQTTVQTTSGTSYLAKYKDVPTVAVHNSDSISIEDQIRSVAAVEPVLNFPARIGLARIENGRLSTADAIEVEAWTRVKENLGDRFGTFVPLSPLVTHMVSQSVSSQSNTQIKDVMNQIRLGAARQHLDAVLVYEVYSKSSLDSNFLTIADLTIIGGYFLPSHKVEAAGYATAMLIDVIQGYPYGMVGVTLDKEQAYSSSWLRGDRSRRLKASVETKAAIKLTEEVEGMFERLRWELAERRAKK